MAKQCVVVGCGAHASAVISIVESSAEQYEIIGLVDTENQFDPNEKKSGYSVAFSLSEFLNSPNKYKHLACFIAIGCNFTRAKVFECLIEKGFEVPSVVSRHAFVDRTVKMAEGNVVGHYSIINAQAKLGCNNIINSGAIVEHHCEINNHTHIAPRAILCGSIKVSDLVFIGAGAVITPNLTIEKESIVGAASLLLNDIFEKKSTFLGVPAKVKKT